MHHRLLPALALVAGCLTSSSQDPTVDPPLAMLGGTSTSGTGTPATGTTPTGTSTTVVAGPCPHPIFEVASGRSITLSWEGLTESFDGEPMDPPLDSQLAIQVRVLSADAAEVEATCDFVGPPGSLVTVTFVDTIDEQPAAVIESALLLDGKASWFRFVLLSATAPGMIQFLVEPTAISSIESIALTPEMWATEMEAP